MNVLVCGSTGCIGRAVTANLRWRGHRVVETARIESATSATTIALDYANPLAPAAWAERLRAHGIDAVVNCAGILSPHGTSSFDRVHAAGPIELFHGAVLAGVGRIVQVSALGVAGSGPAGEPEPPYLRSKRLADDALLAMAVDAAVVRPSLVYGPGSQSGSLFATLASLPIISLPGRGEQRLQPIHVFEVAEAITALVERTGSARGIYELGGGTVASYREMLAAYRAAQHLGAALWLRVPMLLMRLSAAVAERMPQQVFTRDTVRLLERGNVTVRNAAAVLLGRPPSSLAEGLAVTPPVPAIDLRVQLSPPIETALRLSLGLLWIYISVVSALLPERSGVLALLARCGFDGAWGPAALAVSCTLNMALGVATLWRPTPWVYAVQAGAVVGYTATAAFFVPELTIDHCGPLAKNVPLLFFILALWLARAGRPEVVTATRRRNAQRRQNLAGPAWLGSLDATGRAFSAGLDRVQAGGTVASAAGP